LEAKALAADSKSEGMRLLFDAEYSVTQVKQIFGVGYAFAYGVAKRAGKVETAAARRAPKRAAKPAAKAAAAKPTKRVTTTKAPLATVKKVASGGKPVTSLAAAKAKTAVKPPLAIKKPGRPSATRRAVNRKAAMTA
jgi:hypothetical protein